MKDWLKGGILAISAYTVLILTLVILSNLSSNIAQNSPVKVMPGLGAIVIVTLVFYALLSFGVGALIGLIVGKIKSKK